MISSKGFKLLKRYKKFYKKRKNERYENNKLREESILNAKNLYLNAKNNPGTLHAKNQHEQKQMIKNRKKEYLNKITLKNTSLNDKEFFEYVICPITNFDYKTAKLVPIEEWLKEFNLEKCFDISGTLYYLNDYGQRVFEEYSRNIFFDLMIKIITVVLSCVAIVISIIALVIGK